ncbi:MAG: hypothetical protein U1F77_04290 [Kiritimatiellia bacterium]
MAGGIWPSTSPSSFHLFQADREPTYWPPFREHTRRHGRQAHLIEWQPGALREDGRQRALPMALHDASANAQTPWRSGRGTTFSAVELLDACFEAGLSAVVAVLGTHNDILVCDFAQVPLSSLDSRRSHHIVYRMPDLRRPHPRPQTRNRC